MSLEDPAAPERGTRPMPRHATFGLPHVDAFLAVGDRCEWMAYAEEGVVLEVHPMHCVVKFDDEFFGTKSIRHLWLEKVA